MIICLAIFSGCSSNTIDNEQNNQYQATPEADKSNVGTPQDDESNVLDLQDILALTPQNINGYSYTGNTKTLNINASVNLNNITATDLKTFSYQAIKYDSDFRPEMVEAFFGAAIEPSEDCGDGTYMYRDINNTNTYRYSIFRNSYSIYNYSTDFYPFEDGMYISPTQTNCNFTPEQAEIFATEFLNCIDFENYKLWNITGHGKGGRHQYYQVKFFHTINNIPVLSHIEFAQLVFLVDNQGLSSASIGSYEILNSEAPSDLLSLNDAIEILSSQIDTVNLFTQSPDVFADVIDENERFHTYNINDIQLVYMLFADDVDLGFIRPAWYFGIEIPNTENTDPNKIIAVDAITGNLEVVYE